MQIPETYAQGFLIQYIWRMTQQSAFQQAFQVTLMQMFQGPQMNKHYNLSSSTTLSGTVVQFLLVLMQMVSIYLTNIY